MIDYDSEENFQIKQDFVRKEVYLNIGDLEEHLFDWDGMKYCSFDEWDNMWHVTCPECGEEIPCDILDAEDEPLCPSCMHDLTHEMCNPEAAEMLEFYVVSPQLGKDLKSYGEPVYERAGGWFWGRKTSGQSIALDWVISQICEDLHLLKEDNKNDKTQD